MGKGSWRTATNQSVKSLQNFSDHFKSESASLRRGNGYGEPCFQQELSPARAAEGTARNGAAAPSSVGML